MKYETSNSKWSNNTRRQYSYLPEDNILDEIIQSSWNIDSARWDNKKNTRYTYLANSIKQTYLDWDANTKKWINSYTLEKFYNQDNIVLYSITKNWNLDKSIWENFQKDTFSYNENLFKTKFISYLWDNTSDKWYTNQVSTYSYNTDLTVNQQVDSYFDLLQGEVVQREKRENIYQDGKWQETTIYAWDQNSSSWKENSKYANFFISPVYSAINNQVSNSNMHLQIFPNPCQDQLFLYLSSQESAGNFVIYNLNGEILFSEKIEKDRSVLDMPELQPGVYLASFQTRERIYTCKLLKTK